MTDTSTALADTEAAGAERPAPEAPSRPPSSRGSDALQLVAAALSAGVFVWLVVHLTQLVAPPFVIAVFWYLVLLGVYWVVVLDTRGPLIAGDRVASVLVTTGAFLAFVPLVFILYLVADKGLPVLVRGFPKFFTQTLETFGPLDTAEGGGALHSIVGTLQQVGLATVTSVPVAVLTAVYLNEIGGRMAPFLRFIVDAMSGLPSIVAGLFVFSVWVVRYHKGFSGVAGSAALFMLMLPTVTRTAEEILRTIPGSLREAALAVGAPEWRMILRVVLPTARNGLITGAILGVARAVGETAPVLLTAVGNPAMNSNPWLAPQDDLPLFVYNAIKAPLPAVVEQAWAGALVLVVLVLVLFTAARVVGSARRPGQR